MKPNRRRSRPRKAKTTSVPPIVRSVGRGMGAGLGGYIKGVSAIADMLPQTRSGKRKPRRRRKMQ